MTEFKVVTAVCFCGRNVFSTSVAKSELPLQSGMCHCYGCRHVSGTLGYSNTRWPGSMPDVSNLVRYDFSPRVWTYFCGTCGTYMFWHQHEDPAIFSVNTGVLDKPDETVEIVNHSWVAGTRDGGWADFVPVIDNRPLPRWKYRSNSNPQDLSELLPIGWKWDTDDNNNNSSSNSNSTPQRDETLKAHCLCKGVEFYITRPSAYKTPGVAEGQEWWRISGDRYPAGCCVCHFCRLAAGCDVQHWAYVPQSNIKMTDGSDFKLEFGTLKTYRSSHEASRQFCGRCGATVFYTADDRVGGERPGLMDVAVGLLADPNGARAEDWLAWRTWRISWPNDAIHTRLRDALVVGLKDWGDKQPNGSYQKLGKEESLRCFRGLLDATGCDA